MSLEDLGNIGEFVAAIAVIVSLVYLAVQIRQNTRTVRASTYQAVLDYSSRAVELVLANPHLERVYRVGRRDPSQLTEDERPQFRMLIAQFLTVYETMFLQYRCGILDEEYWSRRLGALTNLFSQPGIREYWLSVRERDRMPTRVREFEELLNSLVESSSAPS
jgi:hypothetical protein